MVLGMDGVQRWYCELRRGSEARDVTFLSHDPGSVRCRECKEGGPGELILYLSSGNEWSLGILGARETVRVGFFFFLGSKFTTRGVVMMLLELLCGEGS